MNKHDFLNIENWYGSYYELAIEYHPFGDDARILGAIQALWAMEYFLGPWNRKTDFGSASETPKSVSRDGSNHLYGLLKLPGTKTQIGCLSLTVRETVRENSNSDWLCLCLPTGMLEQSFDVTYPLFSKPNNWINKIDKIFLNIAQFIYQKAPFDLAIIGEEVSGYTHANKINKGELSKSGYILPDRIATQFKELKNQTILPNGLSWFT